MISSLPCLAADIMATCLCKKETQDSNSPVIMKVPDLSTCCPKSLKGIDIAIFRVARPDWSAVAKRGCKRGQNLAKFTAKEFSLLNNNRPIVEVI